MVHIYAEKDIMAPRAEGARIVGYIDTYEVYWRLQTQENVSWPKTQKHQEKNKYRILTIEDDITVFSLEASILDQMEKAIQSR